MARPLIGLIDCNNFFVSCERLFRPDLRQTPVVVLSSNDGCIVARSQEIKDKGIPMGVPYFQVKDMLSDIGAVVFSSHFTLYRDISARVFSVVRREIPDMEQYSIDEAFLLLDPETAMAVATRLRAIVYKEVGIPVSIGIGLSKTQAKYANSLAKKTTGVCQLSPLEWEERLATIKLGEIWGVGAGRTRQFAERGIHTVADYLALPRTLARQLFGLDGERLWYELKGVASHVLQPDAVLPQTLMSTRSFAQETTSETVVREALLYHLHEIVRDLGNKRAVASSLRVLAYPSRFGDYFLQGMSVEVRLPVPTRDIFVLEKLVVGALREQYRPQVPYKKAGIVVNVLGEVGLSKSLFEIEESARTTELSDLLLKVNRRQGRNLLTLGSIPRQRQAWSAKTDALSPAYTTNWDSLCTVKA